MTSKIVVNNIEADSGINTVTFNSNISGNLIGNVTGNVNSTGVTTVTSLRIGTGTSISSPATNVLALGTNNTERVRITSTGSVGIGTDNPGYKLHIEGTGETALTIEGDAAPSDSGGLLILKNNNTTANSINQIQSADAGGQTTSAISFYNVDNGTNEGYMSFLTRPSGGVPTEAARFTSSGNLRFPSGQGIDFSATANSSGTMTSELLSDYEEGTWSPTFIGEGGVNPTVTYSLQLGRYVKIGQMVYASGNITLSAVSGTGSANLQIGGWPFTVGPSVDTNRTTVVDVGFANNWTTASPTRGYLRESQTGSYLTTISGTTVTFIATNHLQSTSALYFKIVYTTSQ